MKKGVKRRGNQMSDKVKVINDKSIKMVVKIKNDDQNDSPFVHCSFKFGYVTMKLRLIFEQNMR